MSSQKYKVFIARHDYEPAMLEPLRALCDLDIYEGPGICPKDEYLKRVKGIHALCIHPGVGHVDKEVLEAAGPQLKVVGTMSVGYDHIDVEACKAKGVKVGNTPNVLSDSVAEHTVCLALMVLRRIPFLMGRVLHDCLDF